MPPQHLDDLQKALALAVRDALQAPAYQRPNYIGHHLKAQLDGTQIPAVDSTVPRCFSHDGFTVLNGFEHGASRECELKELAKLLSRVVNDVRHNVDGCNGPTVTAVADALITPSVEAMLKEMASFFYGPHQFVNI
mgnify:FL=1